MRQAGKVLRFWVSVLGLVIGLQSAFIATSSESFGEPGPAVQENRSETAPSSNDVAPVRESGDGPSAQASEVARERVRDHSTRSPQEILFLFLKGSGALIVMILIYKGLARWIGSKRRSD
jgi:hypothetical protein